MSGAFPLVPAPNSIKIQSLAPTRVSVAHSLRRSTRTTGAQRWLVTADWMGLTRVQFAPIQAFVIAQRGQWDNFTMLLPGHKAPQGVATGTPLVNGAGQSGRALATKGWSASVTGILKAGDFIGLTGQTKVYMVTADASSDAGGNAKQDRDANDHVAGSNAITVRGGELAEVGQIDDAEVGDRKSGSL